MARISTGNKFLHTYVDQQNILGSGNTALKINFRTVPCRNILDSGNIPLANIF